MSLDSSGDEDDSSGQELSLEQTDKLATLQDMTGIDDLNICRALLSSNNWDLEATAREQLNIPPMMRDEEDHDIYRSRSNANNANLPPMNGLNESSSSPPSPSSTTSIVLSYGYSFLLFPFRFVYRVIHFVSSYFISFFPSEPPSSPGVDVTNFIAAFRAEYESEESSETSKLPFLPLSYHSALDVAKRDLKFLVIYLHSPQHDRIHDFCIQTLKSREFKSFLQRRRNELLLWGCSIESREGYNVSKIYRESAYPLIGVIVLRQNRMMFVGQVEGYVEPMSLISRLEAIIADNEAFVVTARLDREERNITQSLRQEQDAAFQESLRLDQERERAKKEEKEQKNREEAERKNEIMRLAERKNRIQKLKIDLVNLVPEEPDIKDPSAVRLVIKLPEGQRLERKFRKEHSLFYLYYYVFCHPDSPDEFDVTTNFPRKVLKCKPSFIDDIIERGKDLGEVDTLATDEDILTFERAGLERSVMLFVNDLDA
ncbi:FAS-associated factor 2 [Lepeophtheirus salmonis]|uniref:FAS-associated factor 2 n=1 Tax=Lepeophtheirus salmonis TaxID=72036 RepID=UPI001AE36C49|nr:FAS-associated factor 2-like [Lepeophtheirus salmonis]